MGMTEEDRRQLKGGTVVIEPIAAPIPEACKYAGISRSAMYRALAAGDVLAVKHGARTLVLLDSVASYLDSLPLAEFRAPKSAT